MTATRFHPRFKYWSHLTATKQLPYFFFPQRQFSTPRMGKEGNDNVVVVDEGRPRRRGCTFRKNDFLPEESFRSWGNYRRAFMDTPFRFKDRVLTRSMDQTELVEMKSRSQHEMKKTLNWWDLMWFGVGAVIGAGIFVLTGLEAREEAGPAVVLSYVVSGVSALLSVFCYTEFAVEIPVAGNLWIEVAINYPLLKLKYLQKTLILLVALTQKIIYV